MSPVPTWVYLVFAAALGWLGLRWFERVQLYHPSREPGAHPGSYGHAYETARFTAADGVKLHGWFIPASPDAPVALVMHGNAGNIGHRVEKADLLKRAGLSVFLFDYRGYGESEGRPSERGTYLDAQAALEWLRRRGVPRERIFYYGESLGCAVAAELAVRLPPGGVILESPFTSTVDMGRLVLPGLPVEWMVRYRYDTLSKAPRLRSPLLVLHSPQDEIVPYAMGRRIFEAAPQPKRFFDLEGGHNDGFAATGRRYVSAIAEFAAAEAAAPSGRTGRAP